MHRMIGERENFEQEKTAFEQRVSTSDYKPELHSNISVSVQQQRQMSKINPCAVHAWEEQIEARQEIVCDDLQKSVQ